MSHGLAHKYEADSDSESIMPRSDIEELAMLRLLRSLDKMKLLVTLKRRVCDGRWHSRCPTTR